MNPVHWRRVRLVGGAALLTVLLWRVGTGPFLDGVRTVDPGTLAVGAGVALATTVCCAWRWTLVARGLGATLSLRSAVAAYYRSQLLNTVLPAGVVGDVDRGVRHGLGAVVAERAAGQVVQVGAALVVLVLVPSPLRAALPTLLVAAAVLAAVAVVLLRARPGGGESAGARALRHARRTVRDGLLPAWPAVVLTSLLAVVGHVATFVVAARAAGTPGSLVELLPLSLLVLLAMAVPFNVAGWGPREGVAAWAFGAAGLGAGQGVSAAVVYGLVVLVASLPGAGVLTVDWLRRRPAGRSAVPTAARVALHG
jgi:uncharacterized membrane protein YbhN (UPF0104 family)